MSPAPVFHQVHSWLDNTCAIDVENCVPPAFDEPKTAKKLTLMEHEETPRASRTQPENFHPSFATTRDVTESEPTPSLTAQSSQSSQGTSSYASSPSKRRRTLAIQFSGPILRTLDVGEAARWRERRNTSEIPLLDGLFSYVERNGAEASLQDEDIHGIHTELRRCLRRNANEDSWSDWVVLPSLQLARRLSKSAGKVDIVNVKSLDISPTSLLSGAYKKRVDYSIGFEITDSDRFPEIQQSVEHHTLSQSDHWLVNDRALFCHIEIKAGSDTATAESQLKVWCAAGFRKQQRLYHHARKSGTGIPVLAPQPLWIWEKDKVHLLVAVLDSTENRIYFLSQKTYFIDSDNPNSLRPLLSKMIALIDWGYSKYLPWFRELIGRDDLNDELR